MTDIAANLDSVRVHINEAAAQAGRAPEEITLVAVSKGHPPDQIREAAGAGQHIFGESRVQEAKLKLPELPSSLRWHMIGHLQRNKIRQALPLFEIFHGVDSLEMAQQMDRIAEEESCHPQVLLEVNVAGEASKHGFAPEQIRSTMEKLLELPRLQIIGLMAIPPLALEPEMSRRFFARLRELRDTLQEEYRLQLPQLSMGMTNDYRVAVAEGATMVRVGTAIFGSRSSGQ